MSQCVWTARLAPAQGPNPNPKPVGGLGMNECGLPGSHQPRALPQILTYWRPWSQSVWTAQLAPAHRHEATRSDQRVCGLPGSHQPGAQTLTL